MKHDKQNKKKFYDIVFSKMGFKICCSIIIALSLVVFSYWSANTLSYFSGEKSLLGMYETFKNLRGNKRFADFDVDSVLYINVSYDKILRPYRAGDFDEVQGRVGVTDPHKLYKLLSELKKNDNYKYIILDVFFEKGLSLSEDSLLHNLILNTPWLVIPNHTNREIANPSLLAKSGIADYKVNFAERDFVKYPFIVDGQPSMALKMYEELSGKKINKKGLIYHENGRIVRNAPILIFETGISHLSKFDGELKTWYNLGFELLDDSIADTGEKGEKILYGNTDFTKNKYIVIGAMDMDDIHNTYLGEISGPVIHLNAFLTLDKGKHKYSYLMLICMFITFFVLTFLAFSGISLSDYLNQKVRKEGERLHQLIKFKDKLRFGIVKQIYRWSAYLVSITGSFVFLIIPNWILYEFCGEAYEVLWLTIFFTILPIILKSINWFYIKIKNIIYNLKWKQSKEEPYLQL